MISASIIFISNDGTPIRIQGIDGVGVATIMANVGLTHDGFYAHFNSKDGLIIETIKYMFDESYKDFLLYINKPNPVVALGNFIDAYLSMKHVNGLENGCPIAVLSSEIPYFLWPRENVLYTASSS